MRLYKKKRCIDTISTIREAHREIVVHIMNDEVSIAMELIEQCQQGVIAVGELIDSEEGTGTEAVKMFEEYCELTFCIYEDLNNKGVVDIEIIRGIDKLLEDVIQEIVNNIPTQKEIVFLPYIPSMWDSMECEWKKECEDGGAKVYVIPIPYYDKNTDGSVREIHYDIDKYPSYVNAIHYEKYDFEDRYPDKIYIHNPYDGINRVTSVLPFFYSDNLKKITDDLIYVPYFVLGNINCNNETSLKNMEKFVLTPAVFNSHHIILESDNMKEVYVKVLTQYMGNHTEDYWKNKIQGTGSSKLQLMDKLKEKDYLLPDDWKELVVKSDGKMKKIVLYNTSIGALLENGENMIKKISSVMDFFYNNTEDVILLWRPHPLLESTIVSMRPELLDSYKKIKERYIDEGWGIYDDTPELDRAIAVSDAYYGDNSSLVVMYQKTGKPIMIQNCNV